MNSRLEQEIEIFEGNTLQELVPRFRTENPRCYLYGADRAGKAVEIGLSDKLLSKHLMLLGGIGTGKSTALYQIVRQIKASLSDEDVMVIFDTKGDFRKQFFEPGDVVISNDAYATGTNGEDYWNIFNEIDQDERLEENLNEIARTLFYEKIARSNSPFFPSAAKDLFYAILYYFCLTADDAGGLDNAALRRFFDLATVDFLREALESDVAREKLLAFTSYISHSDSTETQGVFSELQQTAREILIGNFTKAGTLSMRKLVRGKSKRTIFIEYDLGIGNTLTPIYRLLFDMAIKEALSRQDEVDEANAPNVFMVADEFRLLPHLQHIDNAVNFGRSLGMKFIVGLQNIDQLYEGYGQERARSILSGFSTKITFQLNDPVSRGYIQGVFGKNRKIYSFLQTRQHLGLMESVYSANVVEDWDISNLRIGEAIIGFPGKQPFFFRFDPSR